MAIEHAKAFVNNFFEDDEFVKTVILKRGFSRNEHDEELEIKKIVDAANSMGFKFDSEEYKEACKDYMNSISGLEVAKKIFHVLKIASNLAKENGNE